MTAAERQRRSRELRKGETDLSAMTGSRGPNAEACDSPRPPTPSRASVDADAWASALWHQSFAELNQSVRAGDNGAKDWQAAAALFARRAEQHHWPADYITAFARALADL
jgi:hypothetical protein